MARRQDASAGLFWCVLARDGTLGNSWGCSGSGSVRNWFRLSSTRVFTEDI
ncbi:hypothetical protein PF010_g9021 [Phytophthora fragariae]|uniref:Uncharacterized protein n=1 Tax=Phytophthora fragariae TaxID=53985 RepID=A0A6A3SSS1_9STRA|nr:hypothetical protein PF003_g22137 [Phytophthora fragariae]KAE8939441.1 hypothetical protein PF009_g10712 [Phytophthora fragariae]KAE9116136.1 hypothetical protein PF007_g9772 [Phytophthora fragariae]KAE9116292.1 hypothetical protein PF010_g9021 [Phytophthora fragariae]KAE9122722.1 hypothetical protein PF006_g17587 [Phytophthora fragariae]